MNRRFTQLRSWLFNLAAGASLLLLIFNLSTGYASLDMLQFQRIGSWEFKWDCPSVTVHRVSSAEETYRQQVENRAIVELWFEGLRKPIDHDIQRLPWNSEPYLAAKGRYETWHEAHAAYERVPMAAGQNWIRDDRIASLWKVGAIVAVLPLVWCIVVWQRVRERFSRRMIRWFRWEPAERIGWLARARRAAFVCVSLISLLLAFAIAVMWIRSHYTGDDYVHTEAFGARPIVGYDRLAIYTYVGGISFYRQSISPVPPRNQSTIVLFAYNDAVSRIDSEIPRPGRRPKPTWTRPNPGRPIPTPWYGVKYDLSPRDSRHPRTQRAGALVGAVRDLLPATHTLAPDAPAVSPAARHRLLLYVRLRSHRQHIRSLPRVRYCDSNPGGGRKSRAAIRGGRSTFCPGASSFRVNYRNQLGRHSSVA